MKTLKAKKIPEYILEPRREGYLRKWEGFHTTNPTTIRLRDDPRVFLGYRAGGDDDFYRQGPHEVWSSSLGMAVLDERGEKITHRFPLPIMKRLHDLELPKTLDEYNQFALLHSETFFSFHDFRFVEHGDYLYTLYHLGSVTTCIDCLARMPSKVFLRKIGESTELCQRPAEDIIADWRSIWWEGGIWEDCGVNGGIEVWPSRVMKGDIVFFEKPGGSLQLCHRPLPDIAVFDTGDALYAPATPDGITVWGVLEQSIRPGKTDNSHIGSNGNPIRAKIGDVDVYIDVVHGCHNDAISNLDRDAMWISYYPYLRVKDYETSEQLYYSEEPILDYEELWRDYAEEGAWVSRNPILRGVMFAGGQVAVKRGHNGLDDEFCAYIGLGDTAVGRAVFRLRDLLPDTVIADILVRKDHQRCPVEEVCASSHVFSEAISGWRWNLGTEQGMRVMQVTRVLDKNGYRESATRIINTRPGFFDADAAIYEGHPVCREPELGWVVPYKGVRWDEADGRKTTRAGMGILVLDTDNPQRVLYRSDESLVPCVETEGWTAGANAQFQAGSGEWASYVPEKVAYEIRRIRSLRERGLSWRPQMQAWLEQKADFWDKHTFVNGQVMPITKETLHAVTK